MSSAGSESLTRTTARGGSYILLRRLVANAIRIGALAVLARQLTKEEFGIVALAQIAVNLLTVFGSGGIITYVICDRADDWETRLDPAFWLNVAMSVLGCLITIACLPLIRSVFNDPLVVEVMLLCLATYVIDQLKMVPEALIHRRLQFRLLVIRDTIRDLVAASLSVVMALRGWGVWSLVVPNLVVAPIVVLMTVWSARYVPRFKFGLSSWRRIIAFTKNVIAEQLFSFVGNEADTAVVGKVMGSATLGVYNIAYQLANLIGRNISSVIAGVSTPALAAARELKAPLGPPYRKMVRVLSLITTPLLLGMFVLADELVALVYGDGWGAAVPLLRIFIVSTLVRSVTSSTGAIYHVMGRPDLSMRIAFCFLALYIPALVISSQWDIITLALVVAGARFSVGIVSLYISLDLINESKLRVTGELLRPMLAGLAMAASAWIANAALRETALLVGFRMAAITALGAVVYVVLARLLAPRAFEESFALVKSMLARKRRKSVAPIVVGEG